MSTFSMSLMSAEGSPCSTTTRCRLLCREPSCPFCRARRGFGAVRSGDVNGLERREACLDENFHFALVAESGDHARPDALNPKNQRANTALPSLVLPFLRVLPASRID